MSARHLGGFLLVILSLSLTTNSVLPETDTYTLGKKILFKNALKKPTKQQCHNETEPVSAPQ